MAFLKMTDKQKCNCGSNENTTVLYNFGMIPQVNNYRHIDDKGDIKKYPLILAICSDCKLLQLTEMPDRENIYRNYDHYSAASINNAEHLHSVAQIINKRHNSGKVILEVGCNDGTLLKSLNSKHKIYGIDPASNVYSRNVNDKFTVLHEFFDIENMERIKSMVEGPVDIIIGINVFAHNDSYMGMFAAVERLLAANGYAHVEVAYAADTVLSANFDTIYHEHFCNYTLTSLKNTVEHVGLKICDVEKINTQGGSLRVKLYKKSSKEEPSNNVNAFLEKENVLGISDSDFYMELASKIDKKVEMIKSMFVEKYHDNDVLILGSPARGVITSNVCAFEKLNKAIAFDDTNDKQGLMIPGTTIMIHHPDSIDYKKYKVACLLAWTYKDNMINRLKDYGFKGKVFIPFPKAEYIII